MTEPRDVVRLAAVGDLHCTEKTAGAVRELFQQLSAVADVVALCGDLTDRGLPGEAKLLAANVAATLSVPAVAVLGNHDLESGQEEEVTRILDDAGVQVLDGLHCEVAGVGFAGTRGFGGGFGRAMLQPWGERAVKQFVQAAIDEALKLEAGLARLRCQHRVAVLHYSPIHQTVEGEPPEIMPFLGSTRLAEPIDAFRATVVLHAHAHHGSPEGRTNAGIPVFNCSRFVRQRLDPARPYLLLELPRAAPAPEVPVERRAGGDRRRQPRVEFEPVVVGSSSRQPAGSDGREGLQSEPLPGPRTELRAQG